MKERTRKRQSIKTKAAVRVGANIADALASLLISVSPLQIANSARATYLELKEGLFNEKLEAFLTNQNITQSEYKQFLNLIETDTGEFFKRLFIVIDRLDSAGKAAIIGKLFSALVKGKIDMEAFLELTSVLENAYLKDLQYLLDTYSSKAIPLGDEPPWRKSELPLKKLSSLGLLNYESAESGPLKYESFHLTPIGKLFVSHTV